MMENNMPSIREMLEQMSTEQLDEMLDRELHKEPVDDNAIRLILDILKDREKGYAVEVAPGMEAAWDKYQEDVAAIEKKAERPRRIRSWVLRSASVAAVLCLLLTAVIPQQAEAENFWQKLIRWTDSVFDFFTEDKEIQQTEYEFKTDNPGLQQVYDAVTELGVTFPVVPMWLPEGYELIELEVKGATEEAYVYSRFTNESNVVVFTVSIFDADAPVQYQKDEKQVKQIELHGTKYNVMKNNDRWVVAWSKENVEGFFTVDCQEETIDRILKSIYTMEDNQ